MEVSVEGESVTRFHLLASWALVEDTRLATREGLEGARQLGVLDRRSVLDLIQTQLVCLIEQQQHQRLEQRHLQLLASLRACMCVG